MTKLQDCRMAGLQDGLHEGGAMKPAILPSCHPAILQLD
jgi:hypothetical protein